MSLSFYMISEVEEEVFSNSINVAASSLNLNFFLGSSRREARSWQRENLFEKYSLPFLIT